MLRREGNAKVYNSEDVLNALYRSTIGNGEILDLDLNAESARFKKAQADKMEMEIAEKELRLVDADVVADELGKMISECRSKILNLPKRLALAIAPDRAIAAEAEAKILVYEALEELARDSE
ncbi:MAG: hypothetical protein CO186_08605 [Zetaproteobacteria bacterium CG_4_9_14_3_um_filter_49_83]|nr:MAG: hypothetical protein CO186_08605 [Zetaproteobacteria bacterium CG_4_9_14_3_um_filter_49_83]